MANNKDLLYKVEKYKKRAKALWAAIIALLLITGAAFYFILSNLTPSSNIASDSEKFQLLDPARKIYNPEDLIVNVQPLRDYLHKFEADRDISIYFEYLPTGANITVSKDAEFLAASLLKVPVAMAVAKKVEDGKWKWSNELVLMRSDKDEKFGSLYQREIGTRFTIKQLVKEMLVNSDNTAFRIFVRNLEPEELLAVHQHLGSDRLFSEDGRIGAKKYSAIFRALYNASYVSDENSHNILEWLTKTPFTDYLAAPLPQDVVFAHKIGVDLNEGVFLDSGIAYLKNRPYLLTVMMNNTDEITAKQRMSEISEKVFVFVKEYMNNEKSL